MWTRIKRIFKRPPDVNIGPGYMHRWYLIPHNKYFNIYLHKIMKDDDDRALHDHPWGSLSFLLKGRLREYYKVAEGYNDYRNLRRFLPVFRRAMFAHRLEVVRGPAYTIFITGPHSREWGFHCPNGWKHWRDYVDGADTGRIGHGCGEHDQQETSKMDNTNQRRVVISESEWKQLEVELARVKSKNDELAAHLERLKFLFETYCGDLTDLEAIERFELAFSESPEYSLAERVARASFTAHVDGMWLASNLMQKRGAKYFDIQKESERYAQRVKAQQT